MSRLLLGALAGIVGTAAMTAVMRRLHRRLPPPERYPLPPREIVQQVVPHATSDALSESGRQELTMAAHFGYGAATGALYALIRPGDALLPGAAYGVLVWAASYLGWIPAFGILESATRHPRHRNALMVAAHLVWGATVALALREFEQAEAATFAGGSRPDAQGVRRSPGIARPAAQDRKMPGAGP